MTLLQQRYGDATIWRAGAALPCASSFTIENVAEGAYQLSAWVEGKDLLQRRFAGIAVEMEDEDIEVPIDLLPPRYVAVQMHFPDGFGSGARNKVAVSLQPVGVLPFADEMFATGPDVEGKLTLAAFNRNEYEINIAGISPPYFVKQITYNGSALPFTLFSPAPRAMRDDLDIVISDKPASIDGSVVDSESTPIGGAYVLLAMWPAQLKLGYPLFQVIKCDAKGHFSQSGLRPGSYRAIAVVDPDAPELQDSNTVLDRLRAAEELELAEGGTTAAVVKLRP